MKRTAVAYLFWLLLGLLGGHRYYLGKWATGLLMTVTVGGIGIWWLIDAFRLPGMVLDANRSRREAAMPEAGPVGNAEFVEHRVTDPNGAPVDWSASGLIREYPDGTIRIVWNSHGDMQLALKDLKLKRKEVALQRQQITREMSSMRADRQQRIAGRSPAFRGGGSFGKFMRSMEASSRAAERGAHARSLAPLQDRKQWADEAIGEIDALILQVEREALKSQSSKPTDINTRSSSS